MNILVVDNDENTVETLKVVLNKKTNYKIDIAYGGKEALEKMKANASYDLLILDIMMPEVNGIDVCQVMMKDEKLKKIPVFIISALPVSSKAFQESLGKFDELSVVKDIIEKPFSIADLLTKVKATIGT